MKRRIGFILLIACWWLVACEPRSSQSQPVEVTREVVRIETRVVEVTRLVETVVEVVVTATPEPATATLQPTPIPEPTVAPTATPVPTSTPVPTPVPTPTFDPDNALGTIIRTIRVYEGPDEHNYPVVIQANPGTEVRVLYRGGQWYQVEGVSKSFDMVEGWVYRDWIDIPPDVDKHIQTYPHAFPVLVGKIEQTVDFDTMTRIWTGKVYNIGAKQARDVQVEISLTGQAAGVQTQADRQTAFVQGRSIEPGKVASFRVETALLSADESVYDAEVLWSE